ncbi:MAG: hypothetical protein ACREVL_08260, partial [Solimonas sp.]
MVRYRQFVAAEALDIGAGQFELRGEARVDMPGRVPRLRLSAADYRLAQLFDGRHSPAERLAEAAAQGLDTSDVLLEGLADRLARAQMLRPGSQEPLPVPTQSTDETRQLGWIDGRIGRAGRTLAPVPLPPSSMPGSRGSPGLMGSLAGLVGRRGRANRIDQPLSPDWMVRIGGFFIPPLATRGSLYLLLFCVVGLGIAFYNHRFDAARNVVELTRLWPFLGAVVFSAYLVNLVSMSARAAAVAHYTPSRPRVGLRISSLYLPALFVDTSGPAEQAGRATRLRIVGAPLVATGGLFVLAALVWFMTRAAQAPVATVCVAVMGACLVSSLIRLNPASRRDGYFLLINGFGVSDLRETAALVFFGFGKRPWQVARREVPSLVLKWYIALVIAFWAVVAYSLFTFSGRWLVDHLRGIGFLLIAVVMGA